MWQPFTCVCCIALAFGVIVKRTCKEEMVSISCPAPTIILVHKARYGWWAENTTCPEHSKKFEERCHGESSYLKLVFNSCNGSSQCKFMAAVSSFGNPCGDDNEDHEKTFWMNYTCWDPPPSPTEEAEGIDWFNLLFWPILILLMICCLCCIYYKACRKDKEESESSSSSPPPRGSVKHNRSRKQEDSTISAVKDTMTDAMSKSVASLRGSIKSKKSSMRTPSLGRQSTSRK